MTIDNTFYIPTSPGYYGYDVQSEEDVKVYAERLADKLESLYGDRVRFVFGKRRDEFQDLDLLDEINDVINENWVRWCFPDDSES